MAPRLRATPPRHPRIRAGRCSSCWVPPVVRGGREPVPIGLVHPRGTVLRRVGPPFLLLSSRNRNMSVMQRTCVSFGAGFAPPAAEISSDAKRARGLAHVLVWRRGWDLNPRTALHDQRLSNASQPDALTQRGVESDWRRGWDLNPRTALHDQRLSRAPHSAALAPLLGWRSVARRALRRTCAGAAGNVDRGTVAEWTIAAALKAAGPKGPGVRIPPVPPDGDDDLVGGGCSAATAAHGSSSSYGSSTLRPSPPSA